MSAAPMAPALAIQLVRSVEAIEREIGRHDPHRLLVVSYGLQSPTGSSCGTPVLHMPNRVLAGAPAAEIWRSVHPIVVGRHGELAWAEDGRLLAGRLSRPVRGGEDLADAAHAQFALVLALLAERGYRNPVRIWNYLPGINEGEEDRERYREFNLGRARAFEDRFGTEGTSWTAPASSAVGTPGDEMLTAFLASRTPVLHLENPRQVQAHQYPRQFGPRAPSFSRASLVAGAEGVDFFLSGTASVVGCESVHGESLADQVAETLRNVDEVLARARLASGHPLPSLARFDLVKVYLRKGGRLETVLAALAGRVEVETPLLVLEADICRRELLVEIEGLALG